VKVEVVRSARRRKTVQAREVGGVLRVSIPAGMTVADEERWVAEMVRRMERRAATEGVDLPARADSLRRRYGLPRPRAIRWVDNQEWRWGSCTPSDGTIRISSRLVKEPGWVLDYVIVHELAHLRVAHHNERFWELVRRYPRAERAHGFLMARGLDASVDHELPTTEAALEGDGQGRGDPGGRSRRPTSRQASSGERSRPRASREAAVGERSRRRASGEAAASAPRLPGF
jgi:predicted metal-dependent hydrolase